MLVNEHLTRQSDLIPSDAIQQLRVSIVGCGAVGSWTALLLAKMGCEKITLYDHDTVDMVNMSSQFFDYNDLDMNKAAATAANLQSFANVKATAYTRKFDVMDFMKPCDVMISAVDCMETRKNLFESRSARYFIDGRMAAEKFHLYVIDTRVPSQVEGYLQTLYSNSEAEQERCTAKATGYCATHLAFLIAREIKHIVCKQKTTKLTLGDFTLDEYYREKAE